MKILLAAYSVILLLGMQKRGRELENSTEKIASRRPGPTGKPRNCLEKELSLQLTIDGLRKHQESADYWKREGKEEKFLKSIFEDNQDKFFMETVALGNIEKVKEITGYGICSKNARCIISLRVAVSNYQNEVFKYLLEQKDSDPTGCHGTVLTASIDIDNLEALEMLLGDQKTLRGLRKVKRDGHRSETGFNVLAFAIKSRKTKATSMLLNAHNIFNRRDIFEAFELAISTGNSDLAEIVGSHLKPEKLDRSRLRKDDVYRPFTGSLWITSKKRMVTIHTSSALLHKALYIAVMNGDLQLIQTIYKLPKLREHLSIDELLNSFESNLQKLSSQNGPNFAFQMFINCLMEEDSLNRFRFWTPKMLKHNQMTLYNIANIKLNAYCSHLNNYMLPDDIRDIIIAYIIKQ